MNFSWVIPGELAGSMGPVHLEELLYLKDKGIGAIVRMERETISGEDSGLLDMAEFVPDGCPPTQEQIDRIVAFIDLQIQRDTPVAVSCRAGIGRTGTVLSCYLVHMGHGATDAVRMLKGLRPGSVESPLQLAFVHSYEKRLKESQDES